MLYFVTGNRDKFEEFRFVLPNIQQLDIDLPEIQELDAEVVLAAKLQAALAYAKGEFVVEDTSLSLDCLNGLPGTMVKWFLKAIGVDGLAALADKPGNQKARVSNIIGYAKNAEEIHFFESSINGRVVPPRGSGGFGWDSIFQPDGSDFTYSEWKESNAGPNSMRLESLQKLKSFLEKGA